MSALPTVLVVEDNPDDVMFLNRAIRKAQLAVSVRVATHGLQAVDYLRGSGAFADREQFPRPDVILLDLKLPYLSGFEVLEWIRSSDDYQELPVMILSGSDERRDHERANALHACAYIVKPAEPDQLLTKFEDCGLSLPHPEGH